MAEYIDIKPEPKNQALEDSLPDNLSKCPPVEATGSGNFRPICLMMWKNWVTFRRGGYFWGPAIMGVFAFATPVLISYFIGNSG